MDNWGGSTIYDLAMTLHTERVARGAAAQHRAATPGARPVRSRLAAILATLAARLDPDPDLAPQPRAAALA